MVGNDERLIQLFLSLYTVLFFPRTPFKCGTDSNVIVYIIIISLKMRGKAKNKI